MTVLDLNFYVLGRKDLACFSRDVYFPPIDPPLASGSYKTNPIPLLLNMPQKPWFRRGFTYIYNYIYI